MPSSDSLNPKANTLAVVPPSAMQMILDKASKTDLIKAFGGLTMEVIIKAKCPSVGRLMRNQEPEKVETAIAILVQDLSRSFEGELNRDDAEEVAAEVASSSLRSLSLEDIYYALRQVKKKKQHGKLNVNKVLVELELHFEKRTEKAGEISYNNHLSMQHKADRGDSVKAYRDNLHKAKLAIFKKEKGLK